MALWSVHTSYLVTETIAHSERECLSTGGFFFLFFLLFFFRLSFFHPTRPLKVTNESARGGFFEAISRSDARFCCGFSNSEGEKLVAYAASSSSSSSTQQPKVARPMFAHRDREEGLRVRESRVDRISPTVASKSLLTQTRDSGTKLIHAMEIVR